MAKTRTLKLDFIQSKKFVGIDASKTVPMTIEEMLTVSHAIDWHFYDMTVSLLTDDIAKLDVKIANEKGNYTDEEVLAFKAKKKVLELDCKAAETAREDLNDVKEELYFDMCEDHDIPKNNVDNVLRSLATVFNSKLSKYAVKLPASDLEEIFKAMDSIHNPASADYIGDTGYRKMGNDTKAAYAKVDDVVGKIMRENFSFAEDTLYCKKKTVRWNKSDLFTFHETYTTSSRNKYKETTDANDKNKATISFDQEQLVSLVKVSKDGKADYTKLAQRVSQITIKKLLAK